MAAQVGAVGGGNETGSLTKRSLQELTGSEFKGVKKSRELMEEQNAKSPPKLKGAPKVAEPQRLEPPRLNDTVEEAINTKDTGKIIDVTA